MSVLLQLNRGGLFINDGVDAPSHFKGGLPFGPFGGVAVDFTSDIDHWHQGLPFTALGRIAAVEGDPTRFNSGSMPLDDDGRLCLFTRGLTNIYVNPELAGGGVDTPATGHSIAFNTNGGDYEPDPNRPGFFKFLSNTQDIIGRSPQQYDIQTNNPGLVVGETYRIGYTVRNFGSSGYGAALSPLNTSGITIVSENRRSAPDAVNNLFVDFTVDDPSWTINIRVGSGTTANNVWRGEVYNPILANITGGSGDPVAWNGGVAFTATGALVAFTQDPPPLRAFSDGFSQGFS